MMELREANSAVSTIKIAITHKLRVRKVINYEWH